MATRTIIEIDQERCDGCGACETGCPEGALRVIDGKARLVGESLCDGLGACIGRCPMDAIRVVEREASGYDELTVIKGILPQGEAVLAAHLAHLDRHGQDSYLTIAADYLRSRNVPIPQGFERRGVARTPVSPTPRANDLSIKPKGRAQSASALVNWPIQLHLANPRSPRFGGADILIAADCTAFALGSFHADLLGGRALVIACPKLDSGKDIYASKLATIIGQAKSVTVAIMEIPCCSGLIRLAREARDSSGTDTPIDAIIIGIDGGLVAKKRI